MHVIRLLDLILESEFEDQLITYQDQDGESKEIKVKTVISAGPDHPAWPIYLRMKSAQGGNAKSPSDATSQPKSDSSTSQNIRAISKPPRGQRLSNQQSEEVLKTNTYPNWNDPNNSLYGPGPESAPQITPEEFISGKLLTTRLEGVHRDIDLTEYFEQNNTNVYARKFKVLDNVLGTDRKLSIDRDERGSNLQEGLSDLHDSGELLDYVETLSKWRNENTLNSQDPAAVETMDNFVSETAAFTGGKVNLNGMALRGLDIAPEDVEDFMKNFEEQGSLFRFEDHCSFTTNGRVAAAFSGVDSRITYNKNIPVIIRIHPPSDNLHSGTYIPDIMEASKRAAPDDENISALLKKTDRFSQEEEFLPSRQAAFKFLGRVRVTHDVGNSVSTFMKGTKMIILDVEEQRTQNEAILPGRPNLPMAEVKPLNNTARKYLTQRMDRTPTKK